MLSISSLYSHFSLVVRFGHQCCGLLNIFSGVRPRFLCYSERKTKVISGSYSTSKLKGSKQSFSWQTNKLYFQRMITEKIYSEFKKGQVFVSVETIILIFKHLKCMWQYQSYVVKQIQIYKILLISNCIQKFCKISKYIGLECHLIKEYAVCAWCVSDTKTT